MSKQLCRIPQELGKMGSIEKHIASGMRKATDTTVPAGSRQPPPRRKQPATQAPTQGSAARSTQKLLARAPLQTRGHGRQQPASSVPCVCASPRARQPRKRTAPCSAHTGTPATQSRGRREQHGTQSTAFRHRPRRMRGTPPPTTMAEPKRTPRLLPLGTGTRLRRNTWKGAAPSRPCGAACRLPAAQ
ncbi:hypothetical protein TcYC6_0060890 [Trypanosoma cruzi]|nr:hypothetical protein TcYC6_0060930 [Trypanosoma cruzi]KAF8300334.1 hypothetical protein TcYC6_0060890 [Trypanosoma cruzi]